MEENDKPTLKKFYTYVVVSMMIGAIIYGGVKQYHINYYGTYTTGIITYISNYGSKSSFGFQFTKEGNQHTGSTSVSMYNKYHHVVGDSCLIKYYTYNPYFCRLVIDQEELNRYYKSKNKTEE